MAPSKVSCSLRRAVEHGDFPWIQDLISQSCKPQYRKIIETLGKEWLSNTRLRKKAYIAKLSDEEAFLLESSSKASDTFTEQSVVEIDLHSLEDGGCSNTVFKKKMSPSIALM